MSQIFWISLIVEGALEIAAIALLLTNNLPSAVSTANNKWSNLYVRLDVLGTFFSVSGLILLVYGLTTGNVHGWDKADVIATLVVAVVLLAIFVFVELKVSLDPILPRYLWSDRIKVLGCAVAALTYAVWQGSNYLLTLQLQSMSLRNPPPLLSQFLFFAFNLLQVLATLPCQLPCTSSL